MRKTPLIAGESRWETPLDATFVEDILADTDVVICARPRDPGVRRGQWQAAVVETASG